MATAIDFECPRCSAACSHRMRGALVRCPRCGSFVQVPGNQEPQFKVTEAPGVEPSNIEPSNVGGPDLQDPDLELPEVLPDAGPPSIVFSCKHCQSRIETEAANAGLPCICPGCHVDLIIPGTARPIFLPPPSTPNAARPPLLDRVMLGILLGTLSLGALLLLSTWAAK